MSHENSNINLETVGEIQEQYLSMYPVEDINFERFFPPDMSYSCCCELQKTVFEATVACSIAQRFPPKVSYTKMFLKSLIQKIEQQGHEVLQEFYTSYTDLISGHNGALGPSAVATGDESFYRTYSPWPGVCVTLKETSNVVTGGTTGLRTWQAAHALLRHLLLNPSIVEGKRVLELGAGLGLLGLGLLLRGLPAHYTFTDAHPAVMEALRCNVSLNLGGDAAKESLDDMFEWRRGDSIVRLATLDWHNTDDALRLAGCDVVLAADVVFDPTLFDPLLQTLKILIRGAEAASPAGDEPHNTATGGQSALPHHRGRIALLAITLRGEESYSQFLRSIPKHSLSAQSVDDLVYSEAPSRPQHAVKLLRLTTSST